MRLVSGGLHLGNSRACGCVARVAETWWRWCVVHALLLLHRQWCGVSRVDNCRSDG